MLPLTITSASLAWLGFGLFIAGFIMIFISNPYDYDQAKPSRPIVRVIGWGGDAVLALGMILLTLSLSVKSKEDMEAKLAGKDYNDVVEITTGKNTTRVYKGELLEFKRTRSGYRFVVENRNGVRTEVFEPGEYTIVRKEE